MNSIQKKMTVALIGLSVFSVNFMRVADARELKNNMGQELWSSTTQDEVLKMETKDYNIKTFKAKLSRFALTEFQRLNEDQKAKAMDYADKTQLSPDAAVMMASPNY
jgi:hypothetical protein